MPRSKCTIKSEQSIIASEQSLKPELKGHQQCEFLCNGNLKFPSQDHQRHFKSQVNCQNLVQPKPFVIATFSTEPLLFSCLLYKNVRKIENDCNVGICVRQSLVRSYIEKPNVPLKGD